MPARWVVTTVTKDKEYNELQKVIIHPEETNKEAIKKEMGEYWYQRMVLVPSEEGYRFK